MIDSDVAGILATQGPLTRDQVEIIDKAIQELETSISEDKPKRWRRNLVLPNVRRRAVEEIGAMKAFRSNIRWVPEEIWHQIFSIVLRKDVSADTPEWELYDPSRLVALELVCRSWRAAALSGPQLWKLSPIILEQGMHMKEVEKIQEHMSLIIQRSGSLPFSFSLISRFHPEPWFPVHHAAFQSTFRMLVEIVTRWRDVSIVAPLDVFPIFQVIPPSPRSFPHLRRLHLHIGRPQFRTNWEEPDLHIKCFAEATELRHIQLNTHNIIPPGYPGKRWPVTFDLPWSQLESYKDEAKRGCLYSLLMSSDPQRLASVESVVHQYAFPFVADMRTGFWFASKTLRSLRLRLGTTEESMSEHLAALTLPSLIDLEVLCNAQPTPPPPVALYTSTARLLVRSGCSLERLSLDVGDRDPQSARDALETIYSLSPNLVELDLTCPPSVSLMLLVKPDSSIPCSLPRLKRLILHTYVQAFREFELDMPALKNLASTRMTAPRSRDGSLQPLETIALVSGLVGDGQYTLIKQAFEGLPPTSEDTWDALTDCFEALSQDFDTRSYVPDELGSQVRGETVSFTKKTRDNLNLAQQVRMDKTLSRLEKVDIHALNDPRILATIGILSALEKIQGGDPIPGDSIFRFRKRAKTLLKKWRVATLDFVRDTCPWHWTNLNDEVAIVRYMLPDSDDKRELVWDHLVRETPSNPLRQDLDIPVRSHTPWNAAL